MFKVARLLQNFGPCGVLPTKPTLIITDDAGVPTVGATATVSGGDATASNQIYTAPWGQNSWSATGSPLVGNGDIDLDLAAGWYTGLCLATNLNGNTASDPYFFAVTTGEDSIYDQIMEAVKAEINAAGLVDSEGHTITARIEIPPLFTNVTTACVIIFPDGDALAPNRSGVNTGEYRIDVAFCERARTEAQQKGDMRIREQLLDLFVGKRLPPMLEVMCVSETAPSAVDLEALWERFQWINVATFVFSTPRRRV